MSLFTFFYEASENNLRWPIGKAGCLFYSPSCREGSHSRQLARAIGNYKAPGLFTEGFYRYSVFSTSLDVSNHHLSLLLALRFIFCLRDRQQPLRVLALRALPCDLLGPISLALTISSVVP